MNGTGMLGDGPRHSLGPVVHPLFVFGADRSPR